MSIEGISLDLIDSLDIFDDFKVKSTWHGREIEELDSFHQVRISHAFSTTSKTIKSLNHEIRKPLKAGGSGEISLEASWGGQKGVEVSINANLEVHDDDGNYVEITVEENSDGTGNASVSVGVKEE